MIEKREKYLKNILIILLVSIFLILFFVVFKIEIIGSYNVKVEAFNKYEDNGAKVCFFNICKNKFYEVTSNVNTNKIGRYKIKYSSLGFSAERIVDVIDIEPPEIIFNDKENDYCHIDYKKDYKATDNYDGDLTDDVIINIDSGKLSYSVKDSSGNETKLFKEIKDISEKPTIKLKGDSTVKLRVGEAYKEAGYTANDYCKNDLTKDVTVEGKVNSDVPGTYIINYIVKNSYGVINKVSRTVIISSSDSRFNSLEKYIDDNNYNVSVGYYNLSNNYKYLYNPSKIYYGASLIKTLDAIYIYENSLINDNTRELVKNVISVSDNKSHIDLVNYIGYNKLKNYGINIGAPNTLNGGDYYGNTTVNDQIVYMKRLYQLLNESNYSDELRGYFNNNYGNCLRMDNTTVMHKYGYYGTYYHDVGIVNDDYVIVVLTTEANRNYCKIINDISKIVYEIDKSI